MGGGLLDVCVHPRSCLPPPQVWLRCRVARDAKRATPNMPSSSSSASRSEGQREQVTSYEEVEVAVLGDPAHTARLTALLTTAEPTRSAALGIERT